MPDTPVRFAFCLAAILTRTARDVEWGRAMIRIPHLHKK
jgi:hypothetical protein